MEKVFEIAREEFDGICYINLVDFDMLYGHRRDIAGYTNALNEFDEQLGTLLDIMKPDDNLFITADHGCDPGYKGTDHTRECVTLLYYGPEKCMKRNAERLNHGIYGGAYLFKRLMKKPLYMEKEQLYIKAVCMCIAQHNIFKSTSDEIDRKLDEYVSLTILKHDSDFKINEEYPLLLFLSLVDTIECVKKFSKSCNSASFLQTETVLSNVQAEITKEKIELDFSSLLERINERKMLKKEILLDTYKDYFENNIKSLGNWTIYKPYIKEGKPSVKVEIKC